MEAGDRERHNTLLSSIVKALTTLLEAAGRSEDSLITPGRDGAPEGAFFWALEMSLLPRLLEWLEAGEKPEATKRRSHFDLLSNLSTDLEHWREASRSTLAKHQLQELRESINRLTTGFY